MSLAGVSYYCVNPSPNRCVFRWTPGVSSSSWKCTVRNEWLLSFSAKATFLGTYWSHFYSYFFRLFSHHLCASNKPSEGGGWIRNCLGIPSYTFPDAVTASVSDGPSQPFSPRVLQDFVPWNHLFHLAVASTITEGKARIQQQVENIVLFSIWSLFTGSYTFIHPPKWHSQRSKLNFSEFKKE